MTSPSPNPRIDMRVAAKLLLDRYDELRGDRDSAPELELLRAALDASAAPTPVEIMEQALHRIALNVSGDHPAQNIAGDALDSYHKASTAPAWGSLSGLLAELDWCIKEGCSGPRSHAALTAARATIADQSKLPKLELVGKIVPAHPVHGWHMEAFKPWDEIGAGARLYTIRDGAHGQPDLHSLDKLDNESTGLSNPSSQSGGADAIPGVASARDFIPQTAMSTIEEMALIGRQMAGWLTSISRAEMAPESWRTNCGALAQRWYALAGQPWPASEEHQAAAPLKNEH